VPSSNHWFTRTVPARGHFWVWNLGSEEFVSSFTGEGVELFRETAVENNDGKGNKKCRENSNKKCPSSHID
jgi:hypothetical protein